MRHESTAEQTPHVHPTICCCDDGPELGGWGRCPACPEHSDQVECPSCHTPYGRPHTDYCQAVAPADYPGQPDHCTYPRSDHGDGRGCQDDNCPRHGGGEYPSHRTDARPIWLQLMARDVNARQARPEQLAAEVVDLSHTYPVPAPLVAICEAYDRRQG